MNKALYETRQISVRVTDIQVTRRGVKHSHIDGELLDRPVRSLFDIRRVYQKALQTAELEPLLSQDEKPSGGIDNDHVPKLPPGTGFYVQTQKTLYIYGLRI
ncbi:hypothetical protein NCS52_01518900 [Fusarium sp. LHS14.1]|nr:hypothetical protein NCS52_01542500 [Fusarium sp. LHS14.1]KAI8710902.1 hypothetical protein NCS52_01518900 [Fusarium sp. LHS14.1]